MIGRTDRRDIDAVDMVGIEQPELVFDAQDAPHRIIEPLGANRAVLRLAERAFVEALPAIGGHLDGKRVGSGKSGSVRFDHRGHTNKNTQTYRLSKNSNNPHTK